MKGNMGMPLVDYQRPSTLHCQQRVGHFASAQYLCAQYWPPEVVGSFRVRVSNPSKCVTLCLVMVGFCSMPPTRRGRGVGKMSALKLA